MERRICPLCNAEKDLFTFEEHGKAKMEIQVAKYKCEDSI
jgi:hypothetical protein